MIGLIRTLVAAPLRAISAFDRKLQQLEERERAEQERIRRERERKMRQIGAVTLCRCHPNLGTSMCPMHRTGEP